ncbi:MAG: tRNA uridine-5-carboxymethylaminomethyl(34) synthesis GTPase MnmE [Terriglobia bacterium]
MPAFNRPSTFEDETIVATATPPGRGGIGVVRLSGSRAVELAAAIIRLPQPVAEDRHATLGEFLDPKTRCILDQVLVTSFHKPRSYTGEDVVEISCHGAPVILNFLVECCVARGARAAEPGEFTLRAFLNGRLDLPQAEAVRDLIDSRTLFQARVAAQQMEGSVSARVRPAKEALIDLIARLEAGIDFAEDDVPVSDWEGIAAQIERVQNGLAHLAKSYEYGRIVREGLSLAITGRPNVGKSSLFNRLLNEERAIVTEIPGTTRDLVSETANLGGIPLRLVDTAGIRETSDRVEKIGVEKSLQAAADADLRILVVDVSEGWTAEDGRLFAKIYSLGPMVLACNKVDLPSRLSPQRLEGYISSQVEQRGSTDGYGASAGRVASPAGETAASAAPSETVWVSALTGAGVPELREKILSLAAPARDLDPGGEFITNLRHNQAIESAVKSLVSAGEAVARRVHHEMLLLDLYDALHALDGLTGSTTVDDLLGKIFSTFCVGK